MPRFSLIVATINRSEEFAFLLQSLAEQKFRDFELIVIDQNPDDRLSPILEKWTSQVTEQIGSTLDASQIKYLRSAPGVSRARNLGLMQSTGNILGFPDDDCWYFPDTLQKVDDWFKQHENYGILSIGSRDELGRISGNRWPQTECDLSRINAFRASATYTYFIRRPTTSIQLRFDECLGPAAGTEFGAGEDTDFLLSLMNNGIRGRFYAKMYVGHPLKGYINVHRAERYGGGFGRVLAKHSLPLLCLGLVTFDFIRAALRLVLGDRGRASHLWAHGRGMLRAYLSK
jgi:glycosyltransferase involved in cell wall biosynthesis